MFCRKCGTQLPDTASFCNGCGTEIDPGDRPQPPPVEPALKWLIPIGRSGFAIAAGYLALFSVLLLPAPFALLFGILAVCDIKRHPEKSGRGRAWFAVVMGGIFTVLLAIMLVS